MTDSKYISELRREYGNALLTEHTIHKDPLVQFDQWLNEVIKTDCIDPTAMVLSTVDVEGHADSRVVLLKGFNNGRFIFFTNYDSAKALQLAINPFAALNFYWPQLARQVRIRGPVNRVSDEQSDLYFSSRPQLSQLSAIVSPQSSIIPSRDYLLNLLNTFKKSQKNPLSRPSYWGGFYVEAYEIEFWQGRDNRLHDRFCFIKDNHIWQMSRLAP